ncbi:MAG: hypothetical protein Q7T91_00530 [Sulfuricurvum sp.]|nr:hypothetical protein [Sulfuricurvum sp.]
MDEEVNELLQKAIDEIKAARREIEQQKQNNLQIANKLVANADILKGYESEMIKEAKEQLNDLERHLQIAMQKIIMITEAYQSHERSLIDHHEKLQSMEADQAMMIEQIEKKYFAEMREIAPLLLAKALRDLVEKKQQPIFQKLSTLELGFDGRLKKIIDAEDAIIKQKKHIYLGVSTIMAIGVIAMGILR